MKFKSRKFNGKTYEYAGWVATKKQAIEMATSMRNERTYVRITPGKAILSGQNGYAIWWRAARWRKV